MESEPLVVIYGVPAGRRRERRLGTGTLPLPSLVLVDDAFEPQLASARPPTVRRVAIGWIHQGEPRVEVIEVLQVMASNPDFGPVSWALELADAAEAPVAVFGSDNDDSDDDDDGESDDDGGTLTPAPQLDARRLVRLIRRYLRRRATAGHAAGQPAGHQTGAAGGSGGHSGSDDASSPPVALPAGLWCKLFPQASFCH